MWLIDENMKFVSIGSTVITNGLEMTNSRGYHIDRETDILRGLYKVDGTKLVDGVTCKREPGKPPRMTTEKVVWIHLEGAAEWAGAEYFNLVLDWDGLSPDGYCIEKEQCVQRSKMIMALEPGYRMKVIFVEGVRFTVAVPEKFYHLDLVESCKNKKLRLWANLGNAFLLKVFRAGKWVLPSTAGLLEEQLRYGLKPRRIERQPIWAF